MKVTVIPIPIGAFGTVTKGLVKGLEGLEIRGRVKTMQTTAFFFLDQPACQDESWSFEETCRHSDFSGKPSTNAGGKYSQKSKIIIIITLKDN